MAGQADLSNPTAFKLFSFHLGCVRLEVKKARKVKERAEAEEEEEGDGGVKKRKYWINHALLACPLSHLFAILQHLLLYSSGVCMCPSYTLLFLFFFFLSCKRYVDVSYFWSR